MQHDLPAQSCFVLAELSHTTDCLPATNLDIIGAQYGMYMKGHLLYLVDCCFDGTQTAHVVRQFLLTKRSNRSHCSML